MRIPLTTQRIILTIADGVPLLPEPILSLEKNEHGGPMHMSLIAPHGGHSNCVNILLFVRANHGVRTHPNTAEANLAQRLSHLMLSRIFDAVLLSASPCFAMHRRASSCFAESAKQHPLVES